MIVPCITLRQIFSSAKLHISTCTYKTDTHTHTHPFNGPFSGSTQVSWYQKGKTNLDFTEARDSEWQWHQLGHIQVCISLQTNSHASTPPLTFLQAGCPSCHPTNSVKILTKICYLSFKLGFFLNLNYKYLCLIHICVHAHTKQMQV